MMKGKILVSFCLLLTTAICGQTVNLSPSTQRWIHKADSILQLDAAQRNQVIQIWMKFENQQQLLDQRKQANSQNAQLQPDQWEKEDAAISAEKKENKRLRDEQLDALLTEEQRIIYQQQIAPNRSPVSHMGVKHDRANCNICVKP